MNWNKILFLISDVTIENIKYEIENNKRYTFLLKAKAVQLKKEIARIQDILQSVKTSSPVEEIKTTDEKEILVGLIFLFFNFFKLYFV